MPPEKSRKRMFYDNLSESNVKIVIKSFKDENTKPAGNCQYESINNIPGTGKNFIGMDIRSPKKQIEESRMKSKLEFGDGGFENEDIKFETIIKNEIISIEDCKPEISKNSAIKIESDSEEDTTTKTIKVIKNQDKSTQADNKIESLYVKSSLTSSLPLSLPTSSEPKQEIIPVINDGERSEN
ncbi:hypothetical protein AYI68_g2113 [Smittium mucronatum]|uniref:Uncharacterized protein n=1 Tax=Smittium mucronatum TaxID=133383 RepID=A0A1R0GRJ6_9FUNG|nr:hypothetical protein AYI68_g6407 [Smittium mucronatum]OLY83745.1 hypothetical protein AYI68_g2113 [Smittium mucronatum]